MSILPTLDVANLPTEEDEHFEFKSSLTPTNALREKIGKAASGFWNSGGGVFIAGVSGGGKPDGGIPTAVGRQSVRDWIDQAIAQVTPHGKYAVQMYDHDPASALQISPDKCVVAVEFEPSTQPPHMAPDNRYYIRAGAHTLPASHYIIEALWAKRRFARPSLIHTFRLKPQESGIIQLGVVGLNSEPAVAVSITLDPLPEMWKDAGDPFPIILPLLDRDNPFYLDLTTTFDLEARVGQGVQLRVDYQDVAGNDYQYRTAIDVLKSIAPWSIGIEAPEKAARALESINSTLKDLSRRLTERRAGRRSSPGNPRTSTGPAGRSGPEGRSRPPVSCDGANAAAPPD